MHGSRGQIELLVLIAIVILFAFFVSGGLFPKSEPSTVPGSAAGPGGQCCDTADCSLVAGTEIEFTGRRYQLIKSDSALGDQTHIIPAQPEARTPDGRRIFINATSETGISNSYPYCGPSENDTFFRSGAQCTRAVLFTPQCCFSLPNNTIIYVCKSTEGCEGQVGFGQFDAYYLSDVPVDPNISNCDPNNSIFGSIPAGQPGGDLLICPTPGIPEQSLQLTYCRIVHRPPDAIPWFSPYCKPAIYLYPTEKTDVNVSIAPKGKLTLSIPNYSKEGWNVTAYPDGRIEQGVSNYDYLYYEAKIPDSLIEKPKEGFVVTYDELVTLFEDLLSKLGLNEKERSQFSEYWLKALPNSPYYFVGIVSISNLNAFSPITITPSPNTVIRVTLYFEALDAAKHVFAPTIAPVKREGFTAVEWGGIVKTDPSQPFSCLM